METGTYLFGAERLGDPLAAFPAIRTGARPYNLGLTEALLEPWLAARAAEEGPAEPAVLAAGFERVAETARKAFAASLPAALPSGDAAVLAALGVTANLLRTLALLGEFAAGGGRLRPALADEPSRYVLSRFWCGLIEHPPSARILGARPSIPCHADALNHRRRELRQVSNALGCSPSAVRHRCEEAIDALGREIRKNGLFRPDDLRLLQAPGLAPPPGGRPGGEGA